MVRLVLLLERLQAAAVEQQRRVRRLICVLRQSDSCQTAAGKQSSTLKMQERPPSYYGRNAW